jgi:hypothetical protein
MSRSSSSTTSSSFWLPRTLRTRPRSRILRSRLSTTLGTRLSTIRPRLATNGAPNHGSRGGRRPGARRSSPWGWWAAFVPRWCSSLEVHHTPDTDGQCVPPFPAHRSGVRPRRPFGLRRARSGALRPLRAALVEAARRAAALLPGSLLRAGVGRRPTGPRVVLRLVSPPRPSAERAPRTRRSADIRQVRSPGAQRTRQAPR